MDFVITFAVLNMAEKSKKLQLKNTFYKLNIT